MRDDRPWCRIRQQSDHLPLRSTILSFVCFFFSLPYCHSLQSMVMPLPAAASIAAAAARCALVRSPSFLFLFLPFASLLFSSFVLTFLFVLCPPSCVRACLRGVLAQHTPLPPLLLLSLPPCAIVPLQPSPDRFVSSRPSMAGRLLVHPRPRSISIARDDLHLHSLRESHHPCVRLLAVHVPVNTQPPRALCERRRVPLCLGSLWRVSVVCAETRAPAVPFGWPRSLPPLSPVAAVASRGGGRGT